MIDEMEVEDINTENNDEEIKVNADFTATSFHYKNKGRDNFSL